MKVLLEFNKRHHYFEEYYKTERYCPNCGKQEVWDSLGEGDYYQGTTSYCTACSFGCCLLGGPGPTEDPAYLKVIEQLKTGSTHVPTTKKGK